VLLKEPMPVPKLPVFLPQLLSRLPAFWRLASWRRLSSLLAWLPMLPVLLRLPVWLPASLLPAWLLPFSQLAWRLLSELLSLPAWPLLSELLSLPAWPLLSGQP
jgi:hypothetical protein